MSEMTEQKNKVSKTATAVFVIIWGIIVFWRVFLLFSYCYNYVDDDQAIMWYGTVHFANLHFPEPCFFGQDYNSMLESLLSVPLYLCGWPLNYAMPTVTTLLCICPYLICSIIEFKRKKYFQAFCSAFLLVLSGWQWDLLTSIPRAWIEAYPWTILGVILINNDKHDRKKVFIGAVIAGLSCALSLTAIAIFGIGMLNYIIVNKTKWKEYLATAAGIIPGAGLYVYQKVFYIQHPEYLITKSGLDLISSGEDFIWNFGQFPELLAHNFCFGNTGVIILPCLIAAAIILLFYKKRYRDAVLVLASVTGSLFELCLSWAGVYQKGSILFGQSRMVLFWSFLVLTLLYLSQTYEKTVPDPEEGAAEAKRGKLIYLIPVLAVLCVAGKTFLFEQEKKNEEGPLYLDSWVSIMPVDSLKRQAEQIMGIAEETGAEVLITTTRARCFAYVASTLYYDKPQIFYVPDIDRRTWIFKEMEKDRDWRVLLYSLPVDEDMEVALVDLEQTSVTEYLKEYNCERKVDAMWWGNIILLK